MAIFATIITLLCVYFTGGFDFTTKDIWNNGTHLDCGGHWHIVGLSYGHRYVYECDTCYASFEAHKNYLELR